MVTDCWIQERRRREGTGWELAAGYRREGYRIRRYRIVFVVEYKSLDKYRNKMNFLTRVLSRENPYQIFSFFF